MPDKSNPIRQRLMKGGLAALVIKVGAAGLQFAMFLVLAQALNASTYGAFSFGFSLAVLLAVAGSFGQRMLSLRYVSIYAAQGQNRLATGRIRDGFWIITLGTVALAVLSAPAFIWMRPELGWPFIAATGVFALTTAWAEYFAFVLRAYDRMSLALAPRDVIWRGLVILSAIPLILFWPGQSSAAQITWLLTALLVAMVLVQVHLHPTTRPKALFLAPAAYDRATWRPRMWGLWGVSVLQIAAPNLVVVLLGLMLSPADTGPTFAALRIALLMNLVLLAANMVVSPTISRLHHDGKTRALQRTCATVAAIAGGSALLIFLGLILFGDWLLSLFGTGFESAYGVLLIVAGAYAVNALTGPTSVLLELTGHDRAAFRLLSRMNLMAMAAMIPMIWAIGPVGAALCLALSVAGWNLQAVRYARREMGIDPSILGLMREGQP